MRGRSLESKMKGNHMSACLQREANMGTDLRLSVVMVSDNMMRYVSHVYCCIESSQPLI